MPPNDVAISFDPELGQFGRAVPSICCSGSNLYFSASGCDVRAKVHEPSVVDANFALLFPAPFRSRKFCPTS